MSSLADQTPLQIDEQLAELGLAEAEAKRGVLIAMNTLHGALGQRRRRMGRREVWPIDDDETLATVRAKAAAGEKPSIVHTMRSFAELLDRYENALTTLGGVQAAQRPLNAEYARRPWARFFEVRTNGGHIHSDISYSRCSRRETTEHGWHPELSGLDQADAVAKLGPKLCTICFPDAPTEWTQGVAKVQCAGGTAEEGTIQRFGMRTFGSCPTCHERQPLNLGNTVRAHKPKAN
jgi:hypothetical protein